MSEPSSKLHNHLVLFDADGFGVESQGIVLAEIDEGAAYMVMTDRAQVRVIGIADIYMFQAKPEVSLYAFMREGQRRNKETRGTR